MSAEAYIICQCRDFAARATAPENARATARENIPENDRANI